MLQTCYCQFEQDFLRAKINNNKSLYFVVKNIARSNNDDVIRFVTLKCMHCMANDLFGSLLYHTEFGTQK